jgi:hypothetical protein
MATVPAVQTAMVTTQPAVASAPIPMQPATAAVPTMTRTTVRQRSRIALGIDYFRVPIPFPRFFSIPGPQRVVTETEFASAAAAFPVPVASQGVVTTQAIPVATQAVPMAPALTAVASPVQQVSFVQQSAPATALAFPSAPVSTMVPAQAVTAVPAVQAAPAMTAMQVVQAPPAAPAVAAIPVVPVTTAACAPRQPMTKATAAELTRQLVAIQALLDQQRAQQSSIQGTGVRGVLLPPIGQGK